MSFLPLKEESAFVMIWMTLEDIISNEISQIEKKNTAGSHMWNLNKVLNMF
jgi:hypothetical protein